MTRFACSDTRGGRRVILSLHDTEPEALANMERRMRADTDLPACVTLCPGWKDVGDTLSTEEIVSCASRPRRRR